MEKGLLNEQEKDSQPSQPPHPSSWRTGFWRRFPHSGIFALATALAASVSMIYIITASDGQPITSWKYQPTVCLAISYTIANIALQYALAQAITIAWWVKALKGDAKVKDLHDIWAFGHGVVPILRSGRSFNLVALAGLAVTLAPINGPLLQRASVIHERTQVEMKNITIAVAGEIPVGYTGAYSNLENPTLMSPSFSEIAMQHTDGRSMNVSGSGCEGLCKGTLRGAGYDMRCMQDSIGNYNYSAFGGSWVTKADIFWSNFTTEYAPFEGQEIVMNFTAIYKGDEGCFAPINRTNCELRPATMEYPFILSNDSITLDPDSSWRSDRVLALHSPWIDSDSDYRVQSTYSGVYLYLDAQWNSNMYTYIAGGPLGWRGYTSGTTALRYMKDFVGLDAGFCEMKLPDPTSDVLTSVRELAFRTALYIPHTKGDIMKVNPEPYVDSPYYFFVPISESEKKRMFEQTVEIEQTAKDIVFKSQYPFLALAIGITLVATGCVFTVLAGWWHLGREVSLSPIEIARAFNAPLLADSHPNAEVRRLLEECGDQRLRYGVVWENPDYPVTSIPTLRLEKTELCEKPRHGQVLGH
ncbi:hypothetical protein J4E93_005473 [Alternaria ventricosa]|uniref:uncharacterized protein n=1 Tax=Alternaria ventricosa TaxID=1187951 RepID=UPI0020C4685C|nr:uncharacterized protein J4E93_005473 [Alternaria ventricosa]KAI4645895.1 hypothetical protein J4E93_005473 [Alternaria ventricosa]